MASAGKPSSAERRTTSSEDSASPIHDRAGLVIGAVMVFKDVSETRAMAMHAVYLAQHDFLTELPNRMLLNDRLTQAIALARRRGHRLAVLFVDLDRFKHVNDSLGHVIGDELLQSVARRLVTCVRSSDTISRQGGDEFVLHYQPKIDLEPGAMTGAETLIRWVHPDRGLMFPNDFVPIAEDTGLIVPIGQWVLREACRQSRAWIDEGQRPISVAVNISAVEFRDPFFLENVRTVLNDTRLDARYLELELTESSLVQHAESTTIALQALKGMGVQVGIDDFGTGYSSLSYLRQFPINVLKVDQSFIHEISADPVGNSIVRAVISMGKSLGHRVVAEGVETREQLAFLQAQRCCEGQGYYFSRPLVAEQFASLADAGLSGLVLQ